MVDTIDWTAERSVGLLRVPTATDDKYSRGVVGLRTGSARYPGAAVLGVEAAWRTGIGMVRYVGERRAEDLVLQRRPETVMGPGRVGAWVIGSGTDAQSRGADETAALEGILAGEVPVVVDAGALDLAAGAAAPVLVTPHAREHERLRARLALGPVEGSVRAAVKETAAALGATVLLKGSRTLVASPEGLLIRVEGGPAWLATAGTGDVLAGIVGALFAAAGDGIRSSDDLARRAATGVWVHAHAARVAAGRAGPGGGPVTALDVAEALPTAVADVLALG